MNEAVEKSGYLGSVSSGCVRDYGGEAKLADRPRDPEIHVQVAEINKNLAGLEGVLSELYKKLTPVSRVEPETANASGQLIGRGTATELGSQLADVATRIASIRSNASQVIRRIEL